MIRLDHIAVTGPDLGDATAWAAAALGVRLQPGGRHDAFGTHNTLLGLADGLYLEAITIDPEAPAPKRTRWFDLDRVTGPPSLTHWICQVSDLDAALAKWPQAGRAVDLARGDLRWRMAVPENGRLPYDMCFPALIQWITPTHPSQMLNDQGCALRQLTVRHPQAQEIHALLSDLHDPRIAFAPGPARLSAQIDTPHGPRTL